MNLFHGLYVCWHTSAPCSQVFFSIKYVDMQDEYFDMQNSYYANKCVNTTMLTSKKISFIKEL